MDVHERRHEPARCAPGSCQALAKKKRGWRKKWEGRQKVAKQINRSPGLPGYFRLLERTNLVVVKKFGLVSGQFGFCNGRLDAGVWDSAGDGVKPGPFDRSGKRLKTDFSDMVCMFYHEGGGLTEKP